MTCTLGYDAVWVGMVRRAAQLMAAALLLAREPA